MRITLFLLFSFPLSIFSQNTLIFSEYGEGSSFNKWIEIYNPTDFDIPLDDYRYNFCWNGCDSLEWEFSIPFDTGYILMSGETYLVSHYDASTVLLNTSNQTTNLLSNGNDVVALYNHVSNTIIDIIGVFDSVNVGVGWDVDLTLNATQDHTMIRRPDVCRGNMGDWSLSDGSFNNSEWTVGAIDDYSNIGIHTSICFDNTSIEYFEATKGNLIEMRDLLGRDTQDKNHAFFYIYEGGVVKKKIVID